MPIEFSIYITPLVYALMGTSLLCALILLTLYRYRLNKVKKGVVDSPEIVALTPEEIEETELWGSDAMMPGVSIIVYCDDTPSGLGTVLESILTQDYDGDYEVIVVNDGSSEEVKDVFNLLSINHHNLYLTFIPKNAQNISRRKLAITLGVKGARYDYVLIIDASSKIPSSKWLAGMARHFADGKEVVLGYATYDPSMDKGVGRRLRSFDTAADAVTYLAAGLSGNPYRGHGGNLGYARKLFGSKGFARSLNLHNGDDDIFISQIANKDNTAIELSPDTRVILDSEAPRALHHSWKWTHRFTGSRVTRWPRVLMGFYSTLFWVGTLCAIAGSILGLPNIVPAIAMMVVGVTLWSIVNTTWRRVIKALGGRSLWCTIPFFVMSRPFYNLYYGFVAKRNHRRNFTCNKA